jgi:spore coat protein A
MRRLNRNAVLPTLSLAGSLIAACFFGGSFTAVHANDGMSPPMTKWVDPMPVPPAATPTNNPRYKGADYYEIAMTAHLHQFHADLGSATVWTYGVAGQPGIYLGPTIVAHSRRQVVIKWINQLPTDLALFPLKDSIDPTLPGADLPSGRAIPHLHGGRNAAQFDGTPEQWWTADGATGNDYVTDTFTYLNDQPASLYWYHDHAMAVTRLQPYLGLAAAYLMLDDVDNGKTIAGQRVPSGPYHLPVVLQDKTFNDDGTLWYPTKGISEEHPVWVPEFFGDTPVINGKAYPYLEVQPRRYRLRFLNGSQARFYNVHFDHAGTALPFTIIGSEGGLLPAPVQATGLLIAPGERFDVIVDFSSLPLGTNITMTNDAPAPYPDGGDIEIAELMQIRVVTPIPPDDPDRSVPANELMLRPVPRLRATANRPPRDIVLEEIANPEDNPTEVLLNGLHFTDPVEDFVKEGTTETWQFINTTGDAHPMHTHLVLFQVVDRQEFDDEAYVEAWQVYIDSGRDPSLKPDLDDFLIGTPLTPSPEEMGYKDTVKAYPEYVTRVRARFDLPSTATPGLIDGHLSYGKWVYHCHILEHEENDMMRPFEVVP